MIIRNAIGWSFTLINHLGKDTGQTEQLATRAFLEAKELHEKLQDKQGIGTALHNLANNLRMFRDKERAKKYTQEALYNSY